MNVVTNNKWIGQRTIRPDGMDKVTGRAQFAAAFALSVCAAAACVAVAASLVSETAVLITVKTIWMTSSSTAPATFPA